MRIARSERRYYAALEPCDFTTPTVSLTITANLLLVEGSGSLLLLLLSLPILLEPDDDSIALRSRRAVR